MTLEEEIAEILSWREDSFTLNWIRRNCLTQDTHTPEYALRIQNLIKSRMVEALISSNEQLRLLAQELMKEDNIL
jgi:hypothetical protein